MTLWIAAFLALAAGGLIKGATGAGAPIVAVPVITLLTGDVSLAVSLLVFPNLIANAWQGWAYRREAVSPAFTLTFAAAGLIGAGVGTVLLAKLETHYLILLTALAVYAYVGFRLARPDWVMPARVGRLSVLPAGLAGGVLQGVIGVSAPVSIAFLNALNLSRPAFLGTISIFFFAMSLSQIPVQAVYGILTWPRAAISVLAVVPILGAMPLGTWLAQRISRETFERVILLLLVATATRLAWVFCSAAGG
ncbi:hypothetical protein SAMN04488020_11310 [Palleronia marisminoris]|uniref:Probable membrane transporter protein n=1 Tax=Palleronia marisminoris TaxID=315423 RepID=A0A1Y5TL19_9RHOB|nr:sulfite exporter TauE/SafE family protein [Palleronia marisminoris]SFH41487.1 hypothetical protein SAMN04488020_11310 [Palleronia marisminoris]SLN66056.1 Sulfite exporter TauE/SafE [Palleronia marisminoris]